MDRVLATIGITKKKSGVTGHGLRHQRFNDKYEEVTGEPSAVRGGKRVDPEIDRAARDHIAQIAGHGRRQIVSAYCGGQPAGRAPGTEGDADDASEESDTSIAAGQEEPQENT
jgi:hypothetical protein